MKKTELKQTLISALLITLLLVASVSSLKANAEAPKTEWEKTYGHITGKSVVQTADGGFVIAGQKGSDPYYAGHGSYSYQNITNVLFKTDTKGNVQWLKDVPFTVNMMILARDGGFVIIGYTTSGFLTGLKIMLEKTDAEGNSQWVRTYDRGNTYASVNFLIQAQDNGFVFGGSVNLQPGMENAKAWIVKTDSVGSLQWEHTYGGVRSEPSSKASSIVQASDGGFIFVGNVDGASVASIDALGDIQLTKTYDQTSLNSVIKTSDGGYLLAGYEELQASAYVIKTDSELNMQWNRTYSEMLSVVFVLQDSLDDGYLFSGWYGSLVKTDSFGNVEWNKEYNGTRLSIIQTDDEGYAFTGFTSDLANSDITYILLVKLAPESATPSPETPVPFSAALLVAVIVIVIIVVGIGLGLLIYLIKKRKH
jgi:hypothetical protein